VLKKWRVLASKNVFRNRWVSIRQETCETHSGQIIDDYFIYENKDVVIIFALTTAQQIVLVRQYKHGAREIITEIPAGVLEENELPETGARRELLEETGYNASEFIQIATHLRSPSNSASRDLIFLAKDAFLAGPTAFDETENVETQLVSLEQLQQYLQAGEISDNGCVAACYRVLDYLKLLGQTEKPSEVA
jgi:8-oxo-dGTP pyrophosphatase MutT (NUDIX family)